MINFFCSMIRQGKMTLDDVKERYPKWYEGVKEAMKGEWSYECNYS